MKTLGLLGGMSWQSTAIYYRLVNELVQGRLGGLHSARLLLYSIEFHEMERLQREGQWQRAGELVADAAAALQRAGAQLLVMTSNTMHKVAPAIEQAISIPLLHITDATAEAVRAAGIHRVGLLGTRFTMEQDFCVGRLRDRHGLDVLVPDRPDRDAIHRVIYDELCLGQVRPESRAEYLRIIDGLVQRGAQGIILGCTEISMLVDPQRLSVPAFDTTQLHAQAAVDYALAETE